MEIKVRAWLDDILHSIEEIKEDLPDKKNFFEYQKNRTARRAIERNLEIIGEAMSRILKVDPNIKIKSSRKIVDFRNRIIHGYDNISDEVVWAIVIRDLPVLEKTILNLLKD